MYNKYSNKKTTVDGIKFDSKREANRYQELKLLEKGGVISNLDLQPCFTLLEKFTDKMGKKHRAIKYKADFRYYDNEIEEEVVEDVKGMKTDVYKIKKKLLLSKYDINFLEI
jgi:hypothetical protein